MAADGQVILPGFARARVLFAGELDPWPVVDGLREQLAGGVPAWWDVLKTNDRGAVLGGEVLGNQRVIVKTMRVDRAKDLVSRAVGSTRLQRQVRGARLAAQAGLVTAEPRLMIRGRDGQGRLVDTLVLDRLPGETLLHAIARADVDGRRAAALARDAGRLTAALDTAGLFNRDHKASNLIVLPEAFDPPLGLIDTVGVRRRRAGDRVDAMLANVMVELIGTRLVPERSLLVRAVRGAGLPVRATWGRVGELVRAHGDPTPSEDPLGYGAKRT